MSGDGPSSPTPRIDVEHEPDADQEQLLSKTLLTPSSEPLNLFRTLVRHPELMKRVNALGGLFMAHGTLPKRQRELVILRVAWNTRSSYEYAQHAPIAERVGLSPREIRELGRPVGDGDWSEGDAALLQFTDELLDTLDVSDQTWGRVASDHSTAEMMELVVMVGFYRMLAGFLKTARVVVDEGLEGLPADTQVRH